MTSTRLLVAGIGNIFHGDDGFGVELAQRLARRPRPDGVRVVDFGIRGRDLAYELLDGVGGLLILDAMSRGGPPGMLYVLEAETGDSGADVDVSAAQAHGMAPMEVFRLVRAMGGSVPRTLVVGCEPEAIDPDREGETGLSLVVLRAVDEAVPLTESLIADMLGSSGGEGHA
jgi:hydrogenase maturation protease